MITSTVKNLPKSTVELEINLPWPDVKQSYDKVLASLTQQAQIPGFRKGKAPSDMVEKQVDKKRLFEEVIREIIPKAYTDALRQHKLMPVISPEVKIIQAKEGEEWVVAATVALKPTIKLKSFKDKIREAKKAKVKIWTPGSDNKKEESPKVTLDDIVTALLNEVEVELSDMLVNQEANRLLSDLIDQTKKLGLTVEQYLLAKGKTSEQLRAEYAQTAKRNLTLEFALAEIADQEKIAVSQDDIDKLISKIEDPQEKEKMKKESYYLAHLIRQQKTLDFLQNL